jgi:hypothetical protein
LRCEALSSHRGKTGSGQPCDERSWGEGGVLADAKRIKKLRRWDVDHKNHHGGAPRPAARPDWRRIHHSPLFWVGAVLFLAAISIYVWSEDLSWRPRVEAR